MNAAKPFIPYPAFVDVFFFIEVEQQQISPVTGGYSPIHQFPNNNSKDYY